MAAVDRGMTLPAGFGASLLLYILLWDISSTGATGVLNITLLSFHNPWGRTYDGQCCDPSPLDGATCIKQCDYVMRLIISGLGRANDHVFLFHRPVEYNSNNLHFHKHGGQMKLTVLFDTWPSEGNVKMNAFFYDYDDSDYTASLVDWFETDLDGQSVVNQLGHHELTVRGNRPNRKTSLALHWTRHCEPEGDSCINPLTDRLSNKPKITTAREGTDFRRQGNTIYDSNNDNEDGFYRNGYPPLLQSPFKPFSTQKQPALSGLDSVSTPTFQTPANGGIQPSRPHDKNLASMYVYNRSGRNTFGQPNVEELGKDFDHRGNVVVRGYKPAYSEGSVFRGFKPQVSIRNAVGGHSPYGSATGILGEHLPPHFDMGKSRGVDLKQSRDNRQQGFGRFQNRPKPLTIRNSADVQTSHEMTQDRENDLGPDTNRGAHRGRNRNNSFNHVRHQSRPRLSSWAEQIRSMLPGFGLVASRSKQSGSAPSISAAASASGPRPVSASASASASRRNPEDYDNKLRSQSLVRPWIRQPQNPQMSQAMSKQENEEDQHNHALRSSSSENRAVFDSDVHYQRNYGVGKRVDRVGRLSAINRGKQKGPRLRLYPEDSGEQIHPKRNDARKTKGKHLTKTADAVSRKQKRVEKEDGDSFDANRRTLRTHAVGNIRRLSIKDEAQGDHQHLRKSDGTQNLHKQQHLNVGNEQRVRGNPVRSITQTVRNEDTTMTERQMSMKLVRFPPLASTSGKPSYLLPATEKPRGKTEVPEEIHRFKQPSTPFFSYQTKPTISGKVTASNESAVTLPSRETRQQGRKNGKQIIESQENPNTTKTKQARWNQAMKAHEEDTVTDKAETSSSTVQREQDQKNGQVTTKKASQRDKTGNEERQREAEKSSTTHTLPPETTTEAQSRSWQRTTKTRRHTRQKNASSATHPTTPPLSRKRWGVWDDRRFITWIPATPAPSRILAVHWPKKPSHKTGSRLSAQPGRPSKATTEPFVPSPAFDDKSNEGQKGHFHQSRGEKKTMQETIAAIEPKKSAAPTRAIPRDQKLSDLNRSQAKKKRLFDIVESTLQGRSTQRIRPLFNKTDPPSIAKGKPNRSSNNTANTRSQHSKKYGEPIPWRLDKNGPRQYHLDHRNRPSTAGKYNTSMNAQQEQRNTTPNSDFIDVTHRKAKDNKKWSPAFQREEAQSPNNLNTQQEGTAKFTFSGLGSNHNVKRTKQNGKQFSMENGERQLLKEMSQSSENPTPSYHISKTSSDHVSRERVMEDKPSSTTAPKNMVPGQYTRGRSSRREINSPVKSRRPDLNRKTLFQPKHLYKTQDTHYTLSGVSSPAASQLYDEKNSKQDRERQRQHRLLDTVYTSRAPWKNVNGEQSSNLPWMQTRRWNSEVLAKTTTSKNGRDMLFATLRNQKQDYFLQSFQRISEENRTSSGSKPSPAKRNPTEETDSVSLEQINKNRFHESERSNAMPVFTVGDKRDVVRDTDNHDQPLNLSNDNEPWTKDVSMQNKHTKPTNARRRIHTERNIAREQSSELAEGKTSTMTPNNIRQISSSSHFHDIMHNHPMSNGLTLKQTDTVVPNITPSHVTNTYNHYEHENQPPQTFPLVSTTERHIEPKTTRNIYKPFYSTREESMNRRQSQTFGTAATVFHFTESPHDISVTANPPPQTTPDTVLKVSEATETAHFLSNKVTESHNRNIGRHTYSVPDVTGSSTTSNVRWSGNDNHRQIDNATKSLAPGFVVEGANNAVTNDMRLPNYSSKKNERPMDSLYMFLVQIKAKSDKVFRLKQPSEKDPSKSTTLQIETTGRSVGNIPLGKAETTIAEPPKINDQKDSKVNQTRTAFQRHNFLSQNISNGHISVKTAHAFTNTPTHQAIAKANAADKPLQTAPRRKSHTKSGQPRFVFDRHTRSNIRRLGGIAARDIAEGLTTVNHYALTSERSSLHSLLSKWQSPETQMTSKYELVSVVPEISKVSKMNNLQRSVDKVKHTENIGEAANTHTLPKLTTKPWVYPDKNDGTTKTTVVFATEKQDPGSEQKPPSGTTNKSLLPGPYLPRAAKIDSGKSRMIENYSDRSNRTTAFPPFDTASGTVETASPKSMQNHQSRESSLREIRHDATSEAVSLKASTTPWKPTPTKSASLEHPAEAQEKKHDRLHAAPQAYDEFTKTNLHTLQFSMVKLSTTVQYPLQDKPQTKPTSDTSGSHSVQIVVEGGRTTENSSATISPTSNTTTEVRTASTPTQHSPLPTTSQPMHRTQASSGVTIATTYYRKIDAVENEFYVMDSDLDNDLVRKSNRSVPPTVKNEFYVMNSDTGSDLVRKSNRSVPSIGSSLDERLWLSAAASKTRINRNFTEASIRTFKNNTLQKHESDNNINIKLHGLLATENTLVHENASIEIKANQSVVRNLLNNSTKVSMQKDMLPNEVKANTTENNKNYSSALNTFIENLTSLLSPLVNATRGQQINHVASQNAKKTPNTFGDLTRQTTSKENKSQQKDNLPQPPLNRTNLYDLLPTDILSKINIPKNNSDEQVTSQKHDTQAVKTNTPKQSTRSTNTTNVNTNKDDAKATKHHILDEPQDTKPVNEDNKQKKPTPSSQSTSPQPKKPKTLKTISDSGPRVVIPEKGLFDPRLTPSFHDVEAASGPRPATQATSSKPELPGARARHVSTPSEQLSVETVFHRYWPAILGLAVGTAFLVAALLTSIACRQQRLMVQRRRGWPQDTPQHLTEPDTSEHSSSASSLSSDNTRSSIHFSGS